MAEHLTFGTPLPPRRARGLALVALVTVAVLAVTTGAPSLRPAGAALPADPAMIRFEGGGWGHGVGMSQYGAYGRALDGHSHAQILDFYYPGADLTVESTPDDIRVHLFSGSGAVFTTSGEVDLVDADGTTFATVPQGRSITIERTGGGFSFITAQEGNLCLQPSGQSVVDHCTVGPISMPLVQGEPVRTDVIDQVSIGTPGNEYQWGTLVVRERFSTTDTLWVVLEDLTMEKYLYGLAEVPASWPAAALEAQAIAGRTYAFDRIAGRRASSSWGLPWDLYSTVNDQVYHGYGNETGPFAPNWKAAVDGTATELLRYNGASVGAFYTSSNGGYTADSGYVFVTSLPYLPARPDAYDHVGNPNAAWTRDYTGAEINTWLANSTLGSVGVITDITIGGNVSASGRTDRADITISGSSGSVVANGSRLMAIVNNGVSAQGGGLSRQILSTKFDVEILGDAPVGALGDVEVSGSRVEVSGWVFDPDDGAAVPVELRVDGAAVLDEVADLDRFDVDTALGEGSARGYSMATNLAAGAHQVCVYAANLGGGPALLLGCEVVQV